MPFQDSVQLQALNSKQSMVYLIENGGHFNSDDLPVCAVCCDDFLWTVTRDACNEEKDS